MSGGKTSRHVLICHLCGESVPIKSNLAIVEEIERLTSDTKPNDDPRCPTQGCVNASVALFTGKDHYYPHGKTHSGSNRYKCRACGATFSVPAKSTYRQLRPEINRDIFKLLVNKVPMRRICEISQIRPTTLYGKIDFLHQQCVRFAHAHEQRLKEGSSIRRLYLCVDRQDYVFNWGTQLDRRNVVLRAVGSADNDTGYVFGTHLDYDSRLDAEHVEREALAIGDYDLPYGYRRFARVWLQRDFGDLIRSTENARHRLARAALRDQIKTTYEVTEGRNDIEQDQVHGTETKLPGRGMQIHTEYTLYGHFFYLKTLFGGVEKLRFFLDQEAGIRAACFAAFHDEIHARRVDAFFVRINKDMTVREKKLAKAQSQVALNRALQANPGMTSSEVINLLTQERIRQMEPIGRWNDRWLSHPFPDMSEPEKAVCYLTDFGDYAADHLARLYAKATLHAIDRYFMQIRRRISLLERPISTASANRTWHGYSAYNPEVAAKLLGIFRIFYNYVLVGKDRKTPAMRLGLTQGPIDMNTIIAWR